LVLCLALVIISSALFADSFVLTGNYLKVGVSNSGALINDDASVGIQYDPTGGGSFGAFDYLTPGIPCEYWSIGIDYGADPSVSSGNATLFSDFGLTNGNPLNMVTTNTSVGSTLSAKSVGTWDAFDIGVTQDLWFDANESTIHFHTAITNNNLDSLLLGAFARGADPDQDSYISGPQTNNSIPAANEVMAVGPSSGYSITLIDDQGQGGVPSIHAQWTSDNPDPFFFYNTPPNDGNGDNSINMAWGGTIDAGQTVDIYYSYELGGPKNPSVPEPCTMSLLGLSLCGLLGLRRRRK
jgi:hypothetical protein